MITAVAASPSPISIFLFHMQLPRLSRHCFINMCPPTSPWSSSFSSLERDLLQYSFRPSHLTCSNEVNSFLSMSLLIFRSISYRFLFVRSFGSFRSRSTSASSQINHNCSHEFDLGDVPYFRTVKCNIFYYTSVNVELVFARKKSSSYGSLLCLCLFVP